MIKVGGMTSTATARAAQAWEGATSRQQDFLVEEEVVSPELVLVDPELARRLRAIEPIGAWSALAPAPAFPRALPAARESVPAHAGRPPKQTQRTIAITVVALGLGFAAGRLLLVKDSATLRGVEAAAPGVDQLAPLAPPPQQSSTAREARRRRPSTRREKPKIAGLKATTHSAANPSRQVSWERVRFATFYNVVFTRGGSRALETWTRRTDLSLPARSMRPGTYRWFVLPGYGDLRLRKLPGRTFYGPVVSRGVVTLPRGRASS
jgi:hypothetical protein